MTFDNVDELNNRIKTEAAKFPETSVEKAGEEGKKNKIRFGTKILGVYEEFGGTEERIIRFLQGQPKFGGK